MYTELYRVKMKFVERVLGSAPRNKDIYKDFVEKNKPKSDGDPEDEAENVAEREERGWTGFLRDGLTGQIVQVDGDVADDAPLPRLFVYDYCVKGFLKEASASNRETGAYDIGGSTVLKRKIGQHIHPEPRRLHLLCPTEKAHKSGPRAAGGCGHGDPGGRCCYIHAEEDVLERPLRADTQKGPRVTLVRSDVLEAGTRLEFNLRTLWPEALGEEFLRSCFDRGIYAGFGQWRTAGWGRFEYEIERIGGSGTKPAPKEKATRGRPKKAPAEASA